MISVSSISVEPRIRIENRSAEGIKGYDADNLYPQRVKNIVSNSGTASACVNLFAKFLIGDGFADQDFWKAKINDEGETIDQLHRKICLDYAMYKGFAVHVGYNIELGKTEFHHIPFELCRLGEHDDELYSGRVIVYNKWADKRINRKRFKVYNVYNPKPEIVDYQIESAGGIENYQGQVYYFGGDYPRASLDSVLEDVQTDFEIKQFRLNVVTAGFLGSHMFELPYKQEEEDAEDLAETIKLMCGSQGAGRSVVVENPALKEGFGIKITKFDNQNYDRQYEATVRTVKDSIIECLGIPPILLGVAVAGKLGSANEIRDAFAFYNSHTSGDRRVFEESFRELFGSLNINISNDYSILVLSLDAKNNAKPALINTLGIGGVQALVQILQSTIPLAEKINTLVIVFGITKEEAISIVPKETLTPSTDATY